MFKNNSLNFATYPNNGFSVYVSQLIGDDSNTGSEYAPFQTIGAAYASLEGVTNRANVVIIDDQVYAESLTFDNGNISLIGPQATVIQGGGPDTITCTFSGSAIQIVLQSLGNFTNGNCLNVTGENQIQLQVNTIESGTVTQDNDGLIYIQAIAMDCDCTCAGTGTITYITSERIGNDNIGSGVINGISNGGVTGNFGVKNNLSAGSLFASGLNYPSVDGTAGQVITTDGAGNLSLQPVSIPLNAFQIYVSALRGNDANTGSFTSPLATLGAALALAGSPSPTAPVVIFLYDGSSYDEQVVIGASVQNLFIFGPTAQINFSGTGDALTINASAKLFLQIATVTNSGTGNAVTNSGGQLIGYVDVIQSGTVAIDCNTAGETIIQASTAINGDITLTGGGNVLYSTILRTGSDATGVVGIGITGTTGPWEIFGQLAASGLNYPTADGSAGNVVTTDGAGNLSLQPSSGGSLNITIPWTNFQYFTWYSGNDAWFPAAAQNSPPFPQPPVQASWGSANIWAPVAGTYQFTVVTITTSDAAILHFNVNSIDTYVDAYTSGPDESLSYVWTQALVQGNNAISLDTLTKNPASSDYQIRLLQDGLTVSSV